jgi:hypothetical protein
VVGVPSHPSLEYADHGHPSHGVVPGLRVEILDVDRDAGSTNLRIQVDDTMSNQFGAVMGATVA